MTVDLKEPVTTFGRSDENTVVLLADEVSRFHAKIRMVRDKTILDDLKSLNGTYVNRQRIVERVLSDADEVWFGGKCRATFHDDPSGVLKKRKIERPKSQLLEGLDKVREEMDQVTASMTMIAGMPGTPAPTRLPDGGQAPQDDVEKMGRAFRRLDALYKASGIMAGDFDLQHRIAKVLDLAMEVTSAERGFLMLRDLVSGELKLQVARGMGSDANDNSPSMGIARKAAEGEPVLMSDAGADAQYGGRASIIRQRILSAMCVPLSVEDRILGSLYVDTTDASIQFSMADLDLFQAMASQSAMAIENVRLYEETVEAEKKRANFGRFLSPAVVEMVMNESEDVVLGGRRLPVTTMYCDIRGFTPLSEGLTPDQLVELLNEHFTAMTSIIFEHEGTLDKFIGDEVMALFGAPISTDRDAIHAVHAAVHMQLKNRELNEERITKGLPTFQVGIGINTGDVFAGFVGSPDRLDFTVMGDNVNVAARFCSVAKGGQIVVGESTYALVKDAVRANSIGSPVLKGKSDPVPAYEILGLASGPTTPTIS
ncbi:MAG: FHA domain-containing protein [Candidatus Hydrogenedentes bacterium]|nr:FHA domain-containing protein [Candidatus Hydrogenedentota bacterium]